MTKLENKFYMKVRHPRMMKIIRPPLPLAGEGTGEGGTLGFPLTLLLSPCRGRGDLLGLFSR